MKRTLPLLAALAVTLAAPLAAPVAAQDISSILNPGNFAARLNTGANPAIANMPADMSGLFQAPNAAARLNPAFAGQVAALAPVAGPEARSLAPLTSITPVPRGAIARIGVPNTEGALTSVHGTPERGTDLVAAMADVAEAAPAGANTLVINGSNTAVIQSGPSAAEAPRLSFWQRLFGI